MSGTLVYAHLFKTSLMTVRTCPVKLMLVVGLNATYSGLII